MDPDLWRQTAALTRKTLTIILARHPVSTLYSALVLPVLVSVYLGLGPRLNQPDAHFGIGRPADVRPLGDALARAGGGRTTVALVNAGGGSDVDGVMGSVADAVAAAGSTAARLRSERDLGSVCRPSPRGVSACVGAVVFHSSPADGRPWNYTLRADPALGTAFRADDADNDAAAYVLPLQRAVDAAIAGSSPGPERQFGYTADSEDERQADLRRQYQAAFVKYLSVAFVVALIGVCYHLPGLVAGERESGTSQLIDAMMPAASGWHRQFARLASHHAAFTAAYLPGWIVAAVVCRVMIWKSTSAATIIGLFVLGGLAITSMSLLAASAFRRAQLSGIVTSLVWIALGIVAQALPNPGTAVVGVLGLLFTPCAFVFFVTYVARHEQQGGAANLVRAPPESPWALPGIVLWAFLLIQALIYPVAAAYLERIVHGVGGTRSPQPAAPDPGPEPRESAVVRVENLSKVYRPGLLRRLLGPIRPPRPSVVAVDKLTLSAGRGQILALLGANGSGKSTTLDIIAGTSRLTSGSVSVDARGGLGVAPQKNVLWDELTVEEHLQIFNRLKAPHTPASRQETRDLIDAIGLRQKIGASARTLSGGQKRKLQLGMMLTGGSAVCCVDEVSSGLDPLSRRKIWDILLAQRGSRTIIMTTHFLDEADLLADKIAILSRGSLRAEGSSAQLKDAYGAGYCIRVLDARRLEHTPPVGAIERSIVRSGSVTYAAPSPALAADVVRALEAEQIPYKLSGPTLEDVFLKLAAEADDASALPREKKDSEDATLGLLSGRSLGRIPQIAVFLHKRRVVFKTNWIPYVAAFLIPIVAAAVTQLLVRGERAVGCTPAGQSTASSSSDYTDLFKTGLVVAGPSSRIAAPGVAELFRPLVPGSHSDALLGSLALKLVDSLNDFSTFIEEHHKDVVPGGWWLGNASSPPTLAYRADNLSIHTAVMGQNFLDTMLANTSIATAYIPFDYPVARPTLKFLQLAVYFSLACSVFPGLLGLYPSFERRTNIRDLQYSSGARALSVWAAHLAFDFSIMLVSVAVASIVLAATSDVWYRGEYLFPVLMLYGLVAILVAYLFSLVCGSALATYAATSVFLGLGFAVYMIAFLYILTFSPASATGRNILIGHWAISAVFPTGSLLRALFVALNSFSAACDGDELRSFPGAMTAYGGPILFLSVQATLLFLLVLWLESGHGTLATEIAQPSKEKFDDTEIADEVVRVDGPGETDGQGLRVMHLTKAFDKNVVVDNVTFGVDHGEVFALLGPNGAGKSTTISLIRGDIAPSRRGGDVFIEKASITKDRAAARQNLGVCPQFDAIDSMTVVEHLQHFARIRGIADINHQVQATIRAVGLDAYSNVMAHTLSGGNKRKLSLAIALTGNPSIILLDEPSSGLDAAAKRIIWRTLETIMPGRSILLTTHSMEEADVLANRAGIMARRMLALGSIGSLRRRFGDRLHIHLVSATAPRSTADEMNRLRSWVLQVFPSAEVEGEMFHGQIRFSVPPSTVLEHQRGSRHGTVHAQDAASSAVGQLLVMLEENKEALGITHHSVSLTTLNEVFLTIVGQHDVMEEGYGQEKVTRKPWWKKNLWEL